MPELRFRTMPVKKMGTTKDGRPFVIVQERREKKPRLPTDEVVDCMNCSKEHDIFEIQVSKNRKVKAFDCPEVNTTVFWPSAKGQAFILGRIRKKGERPETAEVPTPVEAPAAPKAEIAETKKDSKARMLKILKEAVDDA